MEKKSIQILKEKHGGPSKEFLEQHRHTMALQKKILAILKTGPKTPPEVSREIQEPSHVVVWHLMALKKYGQIFEGEEKEGYYSYQLTPL